MGARSLKPLHITIHKQKSVRKVTLEAISRACPDRNSQFDSRHAPAANQIDHVTLRPGAAALAVATDTLSVLFGTKQPRFTAPDGRPAQVVDVTLRPRFDPLANYAKLGDGV